MAVSVSVELLTGSYDAGDPSDTAAGEWPPHPARLYCALVAVARGDAERSALAWLAEQAPPVVHVAAQHVGQARTGYVVTNRLQESGGSQFHPGRTNGLRVRARTIPAAPRVRFCWESADAPDRVVEALDAAARRVPYLGRSTGIALVAATAKVLEAGAAEPQDGSMVVFEPCLLDDAEVTLRVPYPGYLADLDALYDAGRPAYEASSLRGYRRRVPTADIQPQPARSVYEDVVVFRLAGLRAEGRLAPLFTAALRRAVLGRAGDDAPGVLHGHGVDGRPHVGFLALPDVGQPHAAGRLLGLAVAVPELPPHERKAIVAAVLGLRRPGDEGVPGSVMLQVRGVGEVELAYEPGLVRPWGATRERWRRGSRRWVSATPVVLDRYPKRRDDEIAEVLRSCRTVGLPDPVDIDVSAEPLMPGGVRMRPLDLPAKLRGRLFRHVSLTFDRPVPGPMLLGAGRYLGVGLLAPVSDRPPAVQAAP